MYVCMYVFMSACLPTSPQSALRQRIAHNAGTKP
jgi:hypothetical protein